MVIPTYTSSAQEDFPLYGKSLPTHLVLQQTFLQALFGRNLYRVLQYKFNLPANLLTLSLDLGQEEELSSDGNFYLQEDFQRQQNEVY